MKIFLSWSGERSRAIAEALRNWLPDVISYFEPWVSSEDIEKGARWGADIGSQLENTDVGIICLTPENLEAPWILFEAGALAKALDKARVCTYLFHVQPAELKGPLVQFQATQVTKLDTLKLLRTLNAGLGEQRRSVEQLDRVFEQWWPVLEKNIKTIPGRIETVHVVRADRDLLEELLDLVRQQAKGGSSTGTLYNLSNLPFDNLFDGSDVRAFAKSVILEGRANDPNAKDWTDHGRLSVVREAPVHWIDGFWASRWYEEPKSKHWQTGVATILSHQQYVVILHTDPGFDYFMLTKWQSEQRLVGRHYNLQNLADTSPWVGSIVSRNRIDGAWSRGRWDLRRSDG